MLPPMMRERLECQPADQLAADDPPVAVTERVVATARAVLPIATHVPLHRPFFGSPFRSIRRGLLQARICAQNSSNPSARAAVAWLRYIRAEYEIRI